MFGTKKEKRTVAIYARVSTEHEAQLNAIENQKQWYFEFVRNHPDWSFYDMYADENQDHEKDNLFTDDISSIVCDFIID